MRWSPRPASTAALGKVRATTCRAGGGCPLWNSAAAGHQGQATATPPASERACAHGTTASVFNKTLCRFASDSHEVLLLPVARPYCEPTVAHCRFAPRPKSVAATSPRTFVPALLDPSLLGPFRGTAQPFVTLVVRKQSGPFTKRKPNSNSNAELRQLFFLLSQSKKSQRDHWHL